MRDRNGKCSSHTVIERREKNTCEVFYNTKSIPSNAALSLDVHLIGWARHPGSRRTPLPLCSLPFE